MSSPPGAEIEGFSCLEPLTSWIWRGGRITRCGAARLNHLLVPQCHQPYVCTAHRVARAFVEERRRTTVLPPLWGETRLIKLVFGVLILVSARWGKKCCSEWEQQQMRPLRMRLKLDEQEVRIPPLSEPFSRRSAASAA